MLKVVLLVILALSLTTVVLSANARPARHAYEGANDGKVCDPRGVYKGTREGAKGTYYYTLVMEAGPGDYSLFVLDSLLDNCATTTTGNWTVVGGSPAFSPNLCEENGPPDCQCVLRRPPVFQGQWQSQDCDWLLLKISFAVVVMVEKQPTPAMHKDLLVGIN
ncbi:hypothetical protein QOT17_000211 [Balamuthia mandrillaris]